MLEEIIKNVKSENRIAISFTILVLWPKTCNGVVIFMYGSPIEKVALQLSITAQ